MADWRTQVRPWDRGLSARTLAMGQPGRIAVYLSRYVGGFLAALVVMPALLVASGYTLVTHDQRAAIEAAIQGTGQPREIATVVDFLNATGLSTDRDLRAILDVAAATRSADNPRERLAQLALAAESFRSDPAGYVATVRYLAVLPAETRQWLIGRPPSHWVELSRRFSGIEANGPGLVYARQTLVQEEAFLGRELNLVQRRLAQRRTCRTPLDQLIRCVEAAPAAVQSPWPSRPQ